MTETKTVAIDFTELTVGIVSAYVTSSPVPTANLAELIATVHSTVASLSGQRCRPSTLRC